MKILLVTRGSQGDVLPYLAVARELVKRGHEVTVNIPHVFEEMAKKYPVKVVLQDFDNIGGMMADAAENKQSFKRIVEWTREAIDKQFVQVIPLLEAVRPHFFCTLSSGRENAASCFSLSETQSDHYT